MAREDNVGTFVVLRWWAVAIDWGHYVVEA